MLELTVNVDHVATVRQARRINQPDPIHAAVLAELGGANGITAHLREDRRHVSDRDIRLLRQIIKVPFNLEMGLAEEIIGIALEVEPDFVTLVPEKREEVTTEGGLNVLGEREKIVRGIERFGEKNIPVSLFIDPVEEQIRASADAGAWCVELHTGRYCDAADARTRDSEFISISDAARTATHLGLKVHAGHGLDYNNVGPVAAIPEVSELAIGHSIIGRAILVGVEKAVREMRKLMLEARRGAKKT